MTRSARRRHQRHHDLRARPGRDRRAVSRRRASDSAPPRPRCAHGARRGPSTSSRTSTSPRAPTCTCSSPDVARVRHPLRARRAPRRHLHRRRRRRRDHRPRRVRLRSRQGDSATALRRSRVWRMPSRISSSWSSIAAEEQRGEDLGEQRTVLEHPAALGDEGAVAVGLHAVGPTGAALRRLEAEHPPRLGLDHRVGGGPTGSAPLVAALEAGADRRAGGTAEPLPAGALGAEPTHLRDVGDDVVDAPPAAPRSGAILRRPGARILGSVMAGR